LLILVKHKFDSICFMNLKLEAFAVDL